MAFFFIFSLVILALFTFLLYLLFKKRSDAGEGKSLKLTKFGILYFVVLVVLALIGQFPSILFPDTRFSLMMSDKLSKVFYLIALAMLASQLEMFLGKRGLKLFENTRTK